MDFNKLRQHTASLVHTTYLDKKFHFQFVGPDGIGIDALPALSAMPSVAGGAVQVETAAPTADLAALCSWALERGIELEALTVERPTLEDVFLAIAGDHGEDAA